MSLVISKVFTYDTDAGNYIQAVEAADGQALEPATRQAINNFVIGCKQDGIWNAIKASCILSGARTLNGALQPLAGTAPTNNGFVGLGTDYVRKTGLVGNGSSKYLDSNRNNNVDPQNSFHLSAWVSTAATSGPTDYPVYIGLDATGGTSKSGLTHIGRLNNNSADLFVRGRMLAPAGESDSITNKGTAVGLLALNRSSSSTYTARAGLVNTIFTRTSATAISGNIGIFYGFVPTTYSNARLAFYSIGESLDLALLDARVTALITAFGVAIP
jgi:hypothetical protein